MSPGVSPRGGSVSPRGGSVNMNYLDPESNKFDLEILKKTPATGLPSDINPSAKELYLSDDNF